MTLTPGAQLGPYEIKAAIGAGGMEEVYGAWDTRLDRRVAIKVSSRIAGRSTAPSSGSTGPSRCATAAWPTSRDPLLKSLAATDVTRSC
jgi:serine/threonine protein kinase